MNDIHSLRKDMMIMEKEIAVITGATSGLGLAYAERMASDGYDLIITGRREEIIKANAERLKREYGCEVEICIADLSNETGLEKLINIVDDRNISVLVNNAGFGLKTEFIDTSLSDIERLLYLQILTVTKLTYVILNGMKERNRGTIINISSDGTFAVMPKNVVYSSSKLYIINFTEGLHMELADYDIRVQAVCPGFIDSDFHDRAGMAVDKSRKGIFGFNSPGDIVNIAMEDLRKNAVVCVPDKGAKLVRSIGKYMPRKIFYRFAVRFSADMVRNNKASRGNKSGAFGIHRL